MINKSFEDLITKLQKQKEQKDICNVSNKIKELIHKEKLWENFQIKISQNIIKDKKDIKKEYILQKVVGICFITDLNKQWNYLKLCEQIVQDYIEDIDIQRFIPFINQKISKKEILNKTEEKSFMYSYFSILFYLYKLCKETTQQLIQENIQKLLNWQIRQVIMLIIVLIENQSIIQLQEILSINNLSINEKDNFYKSILDIFVYDYSNKSGYIIYNCLKQLLSDSQFKMFEIYQKLQYQFWNYILNSNFNFAQQLEFFNHLQKDKKLQRQLSQIQQNQQNYIEVLNKNTNNQLGQNLFSIQLSLNKQLSQFFKIQLNKFFNQKIDYSFDLLKHIFNDYENKKEIIDILIWVNFDEKQQSFLLEWYRSAIESQIQNKNINQYFVQLKDFLQVLKPQQNKEIKIQDINFFLQQYLNQEQNLQHFLQEEETKEDLIKKYKEKFNQIFQDFIFNTNEHEQIKEALIFIDKNYNKKIKKLLKISDDLKSNYPQLANLLLISKIFSFQIYQDQNQIIFQSVFDDIFIFAQNLVQKQLHQSDYEILVDCLLSLLNIESSSLRKIVNQVFEDFLIYYNKEIYLSLEEEIFKPIQKKQQQNEPDFEQEISDQE